MKRHVIIEKAFELAVEIVAIHDSLNSHKQFVIARQVLRSGTSVGANLF